MPSSGQPAQVTRVVIKWEQGITLLCLSITPNTTPNCLVYTHFCNPGGGQTLWEAGAAHSLLQLSGRDPCLDLLYFFFFLFIYNTFSINTDDCLLTESQGRHERAAAPGSTAALQVAPSTAQPQQVLCRWGKQQPESQGCDGQQKEPGVQVGRGEMSGITTSVKER